MRTKFLLLLGVSGVGKSTVIAHLRKLDQRFVYISPYITRMLRDGEKDKIYITDDAMDEMRKRGEFLTVNKKYGIRYATPINPIITALSESRFPILDWPVNRLGIMTRTFTDRLCVVYLLPPSIEELEKRLANDNRDKDGSRLAEAKEELQMFSQGHYDGYFSLCVTTHEGRNQELAEIIYSHYLKSL